MESHALSFCQHEKSICSSLKFKSDSAIEIILTWIFSSFVVGCSFFHFRQTCIQLGTAVIAKICTFHCEICLRYLVGPPIYASCKSGVVRRFKVCLYGIVTSNLSGLLDLWHIFTQQVRNKHSEKEHLKYFLLKRFFFFMQTTLTFFITKMFFSVRTRGQGIIVLVVAKKISDILLKDY